MKGFVLLFLSISIPIFSQEKLNLDQCIEYAFQQNFELKQKQIQQLQNQNTLRQTKNQLLPSLSANLSQGLMSGRSIDPFTNDFVRQGISSNSVGVSGNLLLFDGFQTKNKIKQNQLTIDQANQGINQQKLELKNQIILAYMQLLLSVELVKLGNEQLKNIQTQLNRTKIMVANGQLPQTSIIDFEAQVASQEFEIISQQNNLIQAKLNLKQAISWQKATDFEVEELKLSNKKYTFTPEYFSELIRKVPNLPQLRFAQIGINILQTGIYMAKASKYPTVSLGAGIFSGYSSLGSSENPYFKQLNNNFNQNLSLNLNLPIQVNKQASLTISTAELSRKIAEEQFKSIKLGVEQQIESNFNLAKLANEKLISATKQQAYQRLSYESAVERFNAGLLNVIDLNNIRLNYEKAISNTIQSKYETHFRSLILEEMFEN